MIQPRSLAWSARRVFVRCPYQQRRDALGDGFLRCRRFWLITRGLLDNLALQRRYAQRPHPSIGSGIYTPVLTAALDTRRSYLPERGIRSCTSLLRIILLVLLLLLIDLLTLQDLPHELKRVALPPSCCGSDCSWQSAGWRVSGRSKRSQAGRQRHGCQ
jgi:hypothetical protein